MRTLEERVEDLEEEMAGMIALFIYIRNGIDQRAAEALESNEEKVAAMEVGDE
jgi:hypothetical protein